MPGPIPILMGVIVLAAVCTWVFPAGRYNKLEKRSDAFVMMTDSNEVQLPLQQKTLDSLGIHISLQKFTGGEIRKAISVPGTYARQKRNGQGLIDVLKAPIKGIIDSIDIILFIFVIGGFVFVFNETGALLKGISWLAHAMKGREQWLVGILTLIFSFLAGSYGMAEESFVFYPILVPVLLAAGYDLLVPLAIIFGGTSIGVIAAFSNPFSTIIASNAAGINWMDGLAGRLCLWGATTALTVWYILRYAKKVKTDPSKSLVHKIEGDVKSPYQVEIADENVVRQLSWKTRGLLFIYLGTFLTMIFGVVFLDWWTLEMSALFLGSAILVAIITGMHERIFIREFIKGAESLMSVAFIIGVARGVTMILNEGQISDSILFFASNLVEGTAPVFFVLMLFLFYIVFSLFIQSSSGMAVLTMPIIGALAIVMNIPGREVVNAYMYGICLMSLIAPTGLVLPALTMVNLSFKTWLKFITPLLLMLTILCMVALIAGIYLFGS